MGFDLLENPFAVLCLATDASAAVLNARARELGGPLAAAASRILLVPNARVQAEVSFLPGLSGSEVAACLAPLANRCSPDLPGLMPLARANVLAHLASNGLASADQLRSLVALEAQLQDGALTALNRSREAAGMPPVPDVMFTAALEHLQGQHADALSSGAQALAHGAEVLLDLVQSLGATISRSSIFLRQSITAWERATSSANANELDRAHGLEIKLAQRPSEAAAAQLAALICSVAARTKPPRELARHFGLAHKSSADLSERWRSLAVDIANLYDAYPEALSILAALADGFGVSDELGQQVVDDLALCRERVASGAYLPEMRRLRRAIAAARSRSHELNGDLLANALRPTAWRRKAPPTAIELSEALAAAIRTAQTDLPWQALREFALALYNEESAAETALALIEFALRSAQDHPHSESCLPALETDRGFLAEQALRARVDDAIAQKQRGRARRAIRQLTAITGDVREKLELTKTLSRLRRQSAMLFMKRAAVAIVTVVAVIIYGVAPGDGTSETASGYERPLQPPLASQAGPGDASDRAQVDDGREQRPLGGAAALSRAQLRWCRFQGARLDYEKGYLKNVENDPYVSDGAFKAAVVQFGQLNSALNDVCGQRSFDRADDKALAAELASQEETLRNDGVQLAENAFDMASAGSPPSTRRSQQSPAPVAYLVGQLDRRAWDAWSSGLAGAFREGALWWANMRNKQPRPTCDLVPATNQTDAVRGCNAARARLAPSDRRRRAEPAYRAGWNNP
jgi:hypothetical protein